MSTSALNLPPQWLRPNWPAPAGVRAAMTTRYPGASEGPYAGLNLGTHVGDAPQSVARNRAFLTQALGAQPVYLEQVHGVHVERLGPGAAANTTLLQADAAISTDIGVVCTVMVADCLPVLLCSADGAVVGAAHAGWRGLLGQEGRGVLETTVAQLRQHTSSDLLAWLGPCIGPQAFEVGPEVRQAFAQAGDAVDAFFQPGAAGKWLANLPGLARYRLAQMGVLAVWGNDASTPWCTVANPDLFFSHRRDRISGRLAACVWRSA